MRVILSTCWRTLLIWGGLAAGLAACTQGGYTPPPGTQCGDGYDPAPMNSTVAIDQNLQQGLTNNQTTHALPVGHYAFDHLDLYYQQNQPTNGAQPFIVDITSSNSTTPNVPTNQGIGCVKNAVYGVSGNSAHAMVVTDMTVNNDFSETVTVRNVGFTYDKMGLHDETPGILGTMNQLGLFASFSPNPNQTFAKILTYFILKNSDTDFELRTSYTGTDGDSILRSSVHMNFTAPPP